MPYPLRRMFSWLPMRFRKKIENVTVTRDEWDHDRLFMLYADGIFSLGGVKEITYPENDYMPMVPLTCGHPSGRELERLGTLMVGFPNHDPADITKLWILDYNEGDLEQDSDYGSDLEWEPESGSYGDNIEHEEGEELFFEWLRSFEKTSPGWKTPEICRIWLVCPYGVKFCAPTL